MYVCMYVVIIMASQSDEISHEENGNNSDID